MQCPRILFFVTPDSSSPLFADSLTWSSVIASGPFWFSLIFLVITIVSAWLVVKKWDRWEWLRSRSEEGWLKIALAVARLLGIFAVIFKALPQGDMFLSLAPWVMVGIAYLIIESLVIFTDVWLKKSREELEATIGSHQDELDAHQIVSKKQMEVSKRWITQLELLLQSLERALKQKQQRVIESLDQALADEKMSADLVNQATDTRAQRFLLLSELRGFLSDQLSHDDKARYAFRVCLYEERKDYVELVAATDDHEGMKSNRSFWERNRQSFFFNAPTGKKAHTVLCIEQKKLLIVPDCQEADRDRSDDFQYFEDAQAESLRSLVAYPIHPFGWPAVELRAALVVDTNAPGFFEEAHRDEIETYLRSFAVRLHLEKLYHDLLK